MEPSIQRPWGNGTAIVRGPAGDRGAEWMEIVRVADIHGNKREELQFAVTEFRGYLSNSQKVRSVTKGQGNMLLLSVIYREQKQIEGILLLGIISRLDACLT